MDNSGSTLSASDTPPAPASRGRGCGCWIAVILVLLIGGATTGFLGGTFALRQKKPTPIEAFGSDAAVRTLMIDPSFADWRMPARFRTNDQLARGKDLFGAECSMCHGQTGKGDAQMGRTMFPPAADLTAERTRGKSDGQLYWLIWHGMNYTGMPGWGNDPQIGGPNDQEEIWSLIRYIRSIQGEDVAATAP